MVTSVDAWLKKKTEKASIVLQGGVEPVKSQATGNLFYS
jgi:hypothetical protein